MGGRVTTSSRAQAASDNLCHQGTEQSNIPSPNAAASRPWAHSARPCWWQLVFPALGTHLVLTPGPFKGITEQGAGRGGHTHGCTTPHRVQSWEPPRQEGNKKQPLLNFKVVLECVLGTIHWSLNLSPVSGITDV